MFHRGTCFNSEIHFLNANSTDYVYRSPYTILEEYCKFGNFREDFVFANSPKRHICHVKNSCYGRDLPISVNNRLISPISEDFIFTKLCIFR